MPLLPPRRPKRISRFREIPEAVATGTEGVWDASDDALLAGFATGDRDAAAVFVQRYQAKMIGLALLITRDRVEAEEVAQDAFVRALRYAGSYDARRGAVSSWLLGIVRNVALDRVRVTSRRREELFAEFPPDGLLASADDIDAVGERDAARRMVALVQTLPVEQRDTLLAVTLYGLTAREVSEASDVPLGTVKTRVRLALRKVRDELGAQVQ
jgi:RNA polymerase sigma-70 factor (ECF subfamily)